MEIHHFSLSQTLAQTNGFLVLFSSSTVYFQVACPFQRKERNFLIFSVSEPRSALFGPRIDFWAPRAKPLINVRFWEVFWRPPTEKITPLPKKGGFPPQNRKSTKKRKNNHFHGKRAKFTKRFHFCFKKLLINFTFVNFLDILPKRPKSGEIP